MWRKQRGNVFGALTGREEEAQDEEPEAQGSTLADTANDLAGFPHKDKKHKLGE